MKKIFSFVVFSFVFAACAVAQDSTVAEVKEAPKQKFTRATFNSSKIINLQSTEMGTAGVMQFLVSHHFSNIWTKDAGSQNVAQFFGLNSGVAHTYLSFDYSIKSWLNVGAALAGSSRYEGFAKFKLLRQQTGARNIPVSLVFYTVANVNTTKDASIQVTGNKFSFMNQILIARKLSDKLSLQLVPTWVHYNIVPYGINNSNEVFSVGLGGKYKVSTHMNLTFEYTRQLNMYENLVTKNGAILNYSPDLLSAGIEINTGGHLFQFYIGSTTESSNIDQLTRNTSKIKDGNFAMGFTINRSF